MKTMTTYTNFASSAGAAVTTWNYDGYRGWLANKVYADGHGPSYTYTAAGRLQSRLWARGILTSYTYDPAGSLATVGYSDATPGLGYAFDRLGRQIAVTNGATVCNRTYNDVSEPLTEAYTGGPLDGISITNGYDNYLRRNQLSLLSPSSQLLASTAYGYDASSRLASVSDSNGHTAGYTYLANSPLVGQIGFANHGQTVMTTTKTYDYLNRLTFTGSAPAPGAGNGTSPLPSFNYAYNTANQRTQVTNTDSSYWVYQYDKLGQVTSGKRYWANGTPVAGQQFNYNFDDIGNRQSTASGGDANGAGLRPASYRANNLNQYTSRDVPGYATVLGSANPNAAVTVNLQRAVRQGSYFWDELSVNNSGSSLYLSLTNLAVLNNGTNADIVATNTGNIFLPQTPEVFAYDNDGNLTSNGRWTITWDAENRAIAFTSLANLPLAAQKKVDCAYDFQGRRIQKIVSTNSGSAWVPVYTNRYVYDGWNLIAILDPQSSILQSFTWGSDLSGSMQGAGGVGGLLFSLTYSKSQIQASSFYAYDGNGNLSAMINAVDGSIAGQWEYGPFGEVLRSTGPMAKANPFRFSTKFQDDETDLLFYGYRYYDSSTGRWLNHDPIRERGGVNLYGFVGNNSINSADPLGLEGNPISGLGGAWNLDPYGPGGSFYGPGIYQLLTLQAQQQAAAQAVIDAYNLQVEIEVQRLLGPDAGGITDLSQDAVELYLAATGVGKLADVGVGLGKSLAKKCRPPVGQFGPFFDNRGWATVRAQRNAGLLNTQGRDWTWEHFFIRQKYFNNSQPSWLRGFGNSYANTFLRIPRGLNSSLGRNITRRWLFRVGVIGGVGSAGAGGYMFGTDIDEYLLGDEYLW
jgi:RHS repeat-associated protein